LVIDFIKEFGSACRQDIDRLLLNKLTDILDERQKINKINNLLYEMSKKDGSIKNIGSDKKPCWIIV
jgi:ATP-dependent DNA helicase RecG